MYLIFVKAAQLEPISIILISLCADYVLGAFKLDSFKTRLRMDVPAGVLFAASPCILGFHSKVFLPDYILGIMEVSATLLTANDLFKKSLLV